MSLNPCFRLDQILQKLKKNHLFILSILPLKVYMILQYWNKKQMENRTFSKPQRAFIFYFCSITVLIDNMKCWNYSRFRNSVNESSHHWCDFFLETSVDCVSWLHSCHSHYYMSLWQCEWQLWLALLLTLTLIEIIYPSV